MHAPGCTRQIHHVNMCGYLDVLDSGQDALDVGDALEARDGDVGRQHAARLTARRVSAPVSRRN